MTRIQMITDTCSFKLEEDDGQKFSSESDM